MAIVIVGNKYLIKKKLENLSSNKDGMKFNFKINEIKKFRKFKTIAIIGMGGSILGAEAIYNFKYKNKKKKKKKSLFF